MKIIKFKDSNLLDYLQYLLFKVLAHARAIPACNGTKNSFSSETLKDKTIPAFAAFDLISVQFVSMFMSQIAKGFNN